MMDSAAARGTDVKVKELCVIFQVLWPQQLVKRGVVSVHPQRTA